MRPGRLPEDHPLEQAARAKLREPSPQAQAARAQQQAATFAQIVKPRRSAVTQQQPKRRWAQR